VARTLRIAVAVIGVACLLFLNAAGNTAGQSARAFRMMAGEPSSLDPNTVTDFSTYLIVQLFEPMYILRTNGSLQMLGAKSVETSPDGLTWTFRLNPAYKWSDGQPVTAADYEFSWKRDLDPKLGGAVGDFLADVKNGPEYNSKKITDASQVGIAAVDNYTLQVTLAHPAPQFRAIVGLPYLQAVPKHVVEQWGDKWTDPSSRSTVFTPSEDAVAIACTTVPRTVLSPSGSERRISCIGATIPPPSRFSMKTFVQLT